jgi:NADPH2:quinone reductase
VAAGRIRIEVNQTYDLADAGRAHRELEGRKTTGSSIFVL